MNACLIFSNLKIDCSRAVDEASKPEITAIDRPLFSDRKNAQLFFVVEYDLDK